MKVTIIQRGGYFYWDADGKEAHALEGEEIVVSDGTAGELMRFAIAARAESSATVSAAAKRLSEEKANNEEASEAGRELEAARKPRAKPKGTK